MTQTSTHAQGTSTVFTETTHLLTWAEVFLIDRKSQNVSKGTLNKEKSPKVPTEPLDPVELTDFSKMVDTCQKGTFIGDRDKAILLALLDTRTRAQEFLDLNLCDVNLGSGRWRGLARI